MDDTWKKTITADLITCVLILTGYLLGRNSVHSDGISNGDLDAGLAQTQEQQRDAAKSINDAGRTLEAASDTANRIAGGNQESRSLTAGSGDIIDELQGILDEIQGTKRKN